MAAHSTRKLTPAWSAEIPGYPENLAWSHDAQWLAVAGAEGALHLFQADGGGHQSLPAHQGGGGYVAWHPHSELLASGGHDGRVYLWKPGESAPITTREAGKCWIGPLAWSGDGEFLAVAAGKQVLLLDRKGDLVAASPPGARTVLDICWEPSGTKLLTSAYGGLCVLQAPGLESKRFCEWNGALWNCSWSPDGRWLAAGSQENAVHIWSANVPDHLHMPGYESKVRCQAWSADSRWLVTAGGADVLAWDCSGKGPQGRRAQPYGAHDDVITSLAAQNHGRVIAVGGRDGLLVLWNLDGDEAQLAAHPGEGEITACAWSPDDHLLAAADADGRVMIF